MRILKKLGKLRYAFFYTHVPTQNKFLCLAMDPLGCTLRGRDNAFIDLPEDLPSMTTFVKTLLENLLALHKKGIHHGGKVLFLYLDFSYAKIGHADISPANVAMGVDENTFTDEALGEVFKHDMKSPLQLIGVSTAERDQSPRPANLPEYIMRHYGPLLTNTYDMSLISFMDFGEGEDLTYISSL